MAYISVCQEAMKPRQKRHTKMELKFTRTDEGQIAKGKTVSGITATYEIRRRNNCRSKVWFTLYVNGTRIPNNRESTMRACKIRACRIEEGNVPWVTEYLKEKIRLDFLHRATGSGETLPSTPVNL